VVPSDSASSSPSSSSSSSSRNNYFWTNAIRSCHENGGVISLKGLCKNSREGVPPLFYTELMSYVAQDDGRADPEVPSSAFMFRSDSKFSDAAAPQRLFHGLDLSNNNLCDVSPRLLEFKRNLTLIIASHNPFGRVPVPIAGCDRLQELQLAGCSMEELHPLAFQCLPMLEKVDLSRNQLSKWPRCLLGMERLTSVNLANNLLSELPTQALIAYSAGLTHIDVSSNRVACIESGLHKLLGLSFLNLENNSVSHFPLEIGVCPSLQTLMIQGNPSKQIPMSRMMKGGKAVIDTLRNKIPLDSPLLL
jgi:hypothetical protein